MFKETCSGFSVFTFYLQAVVKRWVVQSQLSTPRLHVTNSKCHMMFQSLWSGDAAWVGLWFLWEGQFNWVLSICVLRHTWDFFQWPTILSYFIFFSFQQRIEIHKLRQGDNLILGFSIGGGIDQDPTQNPFSEDKTDKVRCSLFSVAPLQKLTQQAQLISAFCPLTQFTTKVILQTMFVLSQRSTFSIVQHCTNLFLTRIP